MYNGFEIDRTNGDHHGAFDNGLALHTTTTCINHEESGVRVENLIYTRRSRDNTVQSTK